MVVAERRLRSFGIVLSDGRTTETCLLPDPFRVGPRASTGGFSGPERMEDGGRPSGAGV